MDTNQLRRLSPQREFAEALTQKSEAKAREEGEWPGHELILKTNG